MKRARPKGKEDGKARAFSVELRSRNDLRNVNLANGSSEAVLVEGTIGELVRARFAEGVILEVVGKDGVLRVDLAENEIGTAGGKGGREASS